MNPMDNVRYSNKAKVTENVYQYMDVSFNHGAITSKDGIIPKGQAFPVLYYYPTQNVFWIPFSSKSFPDHVINKW